MVSMSLVVLPRREAAGSCASSQEPSMGSCAMARLRQGSTVWAVRKEQGGSLFLLGLGGPVHLRLLLAGMLQVFLAALAQRRGGCPP